MLSRVAESLYWLARYIERAEDVTRLVAVNFNAMLDTPDLAEQRGWPSVVAITGDDDLFATTFETPTARHVMEFLLWHPLNPNAVTACITRARENARSVREQISSEMWEHLNRLYFWLREIDKNHVLNNPSEFFRAVRDGTQAFQGVAAATMTHGEAYQFIQLGLYLERADKTTRILDVQYVDVHQRSADATRAALLLIALLRSCSAFEPFRRTPGSSLTPEAVAEYLLLNREFPRAVLFCLNRCITALDQVGGNSAALRTDNPRRTLGRIAADLDYLDIREVLNGRTDDFLSGLLARLNVVGDDVARAYFNTRVILPDERPRHQPQQQQQQ